METSTSYNSNRKLGIALLGLGSFSTTSIAPSIIRSKHCELRGIITESHIKESMWTRRFNILRKNVYNYQNFDEIENNEDIDIIYIVTPNAQHLEYAIRTAKAKKHVICEKPLGISSDQCRHIVETCNQNQVKLSIGYRLYHSQYFIYLKSLLESSYNLPCNIQGNFSFELKDPSNWRYNKSSSGGGVLIDLGIYGIYISCFLFGKSPEMARVDTIKKQVDGIETTISFELDFGKGKTAYFTNSYSDSENWLSLNIGANKYILKNAISLKGQRLHAGRGTIELMESNQIAAHLDDFAISIWNDQSTFRTSGDLGIRDLAIIEALYKSMGTGRPEKINI